jgi:hypothetical protein
MPIDASIYNQLQPVAPIATPNPLALIQGVAQVQDIRAQVEQRKLAGEAARQKAIDDAQVRSVFAAHGGDVDAAIEDLYKVNPRAAGPIAEQIGKARKETLDAAGKGLDNQKKQLEHYSNIWGMVTDDTSLNAIRPLFVKAFPELDPVLPTAYGDGSAVQRVSDLALSRKEKIENQQQMITLLASGKPQEALNHALANTNTPEEWDQVLAGAPQYGVTKNMIALAGAYSPENKARAAAYGVKPEKVETTDAAGQPVTQFVTPTVGATYPVAPKPVAYQAKEFLLDGRPVMGSFNPETNTYHFGGQDVTTRVKPIPPQGPGPDRELVSIIGPDGKPVLVPRSQAVGQTPASGAGGKPATGTERQSLAFYNRGRQAVDILTTPDATGKTLEDSVSGVEAKLANVPIVGNYLQSEDAQRYTQAQRAFTEARLRKESGARINESEYENDRKIYFKQPGDSEAVVKQKQRARETVLNGLAGSAGKAYEEYYGEPFTRATGTPPGAAAGAGPDLSGLTAGHGRTFSTGPYAGQTWTIGPDGQPKRVS